MKILFIFTGGTIGSTTGDEFISLEKGKPYFDNAINEGYLVANGLNYQWKKSKATCV